MPTLCASSQYSLQYLLSPVAGQLQLVCAHFLSLLSSAMSMLSFQKRIQLEGNAQVHASSLLPRGQMVKYAPCGLTFMPRAV
ncbi:MAG: hypothetical protein ACR2G4_15465 [Pyrinomonadaceae bacterium]